MIACEIAKFNCADVMVECSSAANFFPEGKGACRSANYNCADEIGKNTCANYNCACAKLIYTNASTIARTQFEKTLMQITIARAKLEKTLVQITIAHAQS